MKTTSVALVAAVILLATTVFAHDLSYLGPIKAGATKTVKVDLPAGRLTVEVTSSSAETKFNCQFSYSYGGVVDEQRDTHKCLRNFLVQSDSSMSVSVTNLGKESDYKIWVHDTP
jgi:hypothetical protein